MRTFYRKKSSCQNCQYPLLDNYNYCPNCGQENSEKLVSFSTLIIEFFSNIIAYDSKLGRTVKPFLFKPGYLTNEFITGKRAKYMHPLRLYFIISFFHFFAVTLVFQQNLNTVSSATNEQTSSTEKEQNDELPSGTNVTINPDSLARENEGEVAIFNKSFSMKFLKDKRTTETQVIDSLGWKQTIINRYIIKQIIKFARSDSKSIGKYFRDYMLNKGSVLMFFMLPIFALLLKLVYVRRKRYYVEHLIFSLHIHSFAFLALLPIILFKKIWANDWFFRIAIFIILTYGAIAARNVYRQTWIKTLIKGFLLFVSYCLCFALVATIAVIIAGLIY